MKNRNNSREYIASIQGFCNSSSKKSGTKRSQVKQQQQTIRTLGLSLQVLCSGIWWIEALVYEFVDIVIV